MGPRGMEEVPDFSGQQNRPANLVRYNREITMGVTALQRHHDGLRTTRVVDYRGATMAAAFSDAQTELAALASGCGVYDLGFRAKLALTGKDRVRWLNGMVSNNIRDLAAGRGVYAFILNPQGRILGDLNAYNRGESLLVDTDRSQLEKILAIFRKYIIMDKVEIDDLTEKLTALGVSGPKAREVLATAGFELSEATPTSTPTDGFEIRELKWRGVDCTLVSGGGQNTSYEIWLAANELAMGEANIKVLWSALVASGATPVGAEALEIYRILCGVPLYGVDIGERELPQETEQARALSFTKGCYIGQEIVERIRSRGNVHRTFTGFALEENAARIAGQIACGDKIAVDGKEVGEVTSVASVPAYQSQPGRTIALGYIRREVSAAGREVRIGPAAAKIVKLPFEEIGLALSVSR